MVDMNDFIEQLAHNARKAKQQRDELLQALKAIVVEAGPLYGNDTGLGTVNRITHIARAAIVKAEQ